MSDQAKRALERLSKNVKENSPRIEQKLIKVGVKQPDPALVFSAAKYYRALNKLAKA